MKLTPLYGYLFGILGMLSLLGHLILFASAAAVPEKGDIIFPKTFDNTGNATVKMRVTTPYEIKVAGYSNEFQAIPTFDGFEVQFYVRPFPKKAFITVTNQ